MSDRIDVHQHVIPPEYSAALREHGLREAGGRALPDWSAESALRLMGTAEIATAILSVSTPGTIFLPKADEAADLARRLNDSVAKLAAERPDRFGFFATLPTPHLAEAADEAKRALDVLRADGVVLLANSAGTYLGEEGQDELFAALDERSAIVFVHPAELPGPQAPGVLPFAADFLLDTTRAAYLLVRNGYVRRYPRIRFVLSHAGGFVPYASHRLAISITSDARRSPHAVLEDFRGFYFDTALSASPAALPSLLAFAKPGHVLFGSDWPFAPDVAVGYFVAGLEEYAKKDPALAAAIDRGNAERLFPRFRGTPPQQRESLARRVSDAARRRAAKAAYSLIQPR